MQFDVDAKIVGVQFQLVTGPNSAVFRDVHCERRHGPVKGELPVFITRWINLEIDRLQLYLRLLRCGYVHKILLREIGVQCRLQFGEAFVHGAARSVETHVRFAVERLASLENAAQVFHRTIAARHGSKIALSDHTGHVLFGLRTDPDCEAVGEKIVIRLFFRHHSTADGKYGAAALVEYALQSAPFDRAVTSLTVHRENFGQGHSCALFDFAIKLDERNVELLAKPGTERRLACATKSDQRDTHSTHFFLVTEVAHQPEGNVFEAVRGDTFEETLNQALFDRLFRFRRKQFDKGNVQSGGDAPEQDDGDVSFSRLELREMALGNVRFVRDHLAAHAAAIANFPHARAQKKKEIAFRSGSDRRVVGGLGIGVYWHRVEIEM